MRNLRFRVLLIVLASVTLLGCERLTTAPERDPALTPSASLSRTEERRLRELEESEKDRIDREDERSEAAYDSLKAIWDAQRHNGDSSLIECEPLQYRGEVKIIGPRGGEIGVGPHRLRIPAGALTEYKVITAEIPISFNVSVKLSPSGLQFVKPSELMLSYKHCERPAGYRHSVVYVDDAARILEWQSSWDYVSYEQVFGTIHHFSRYAVASD
jgi:hypothetical protein